MALKFFQSFYTTNALLFKDLIRQGTELLYFDDTLLMLVSKPHMLQLIKQLKDNAD